MKKSCRAGETGRRGVAVVLGWKATSVHKGGGRRGMTALREFTPPAGDSGCLECGVSLRW